MEALSPRQQQVLRSYVRNVEYGEKTLEEWLRSDPVAVARSTWYKADGNYWHSEEFQQALTTYRRAYLGWLTAEERRSIEQANRLLRMEASRAAERMIQLSQAAESETVQFQATKDILNRADESIAEKNSPQKMVHELSDDELAAIAAGE